MEPVSGDRPASKANGQSAPQDVSLGNGAMVVAAGYPPEGRHPVLSSSLNAEGMVKALKRRWLLAAVLGLSCGALAAAAGWFLMPPGKITARAVLRVAAFPDFVLFPSTENRGDFQNYQKTQIGLVKNPYVLNRALKTLKEEGLNVDIMRRHDDQGDTADWLERELKVDFLLGPELLSISLSGDYPEENDLKALVGAVKKAYVKEIGGREDDDRIKKLVELNRKLTEYQRTVEDKRALLRKVSVNQGTIDPTALAMLRTVNEDFLVFAKRELVNIKVEHQKLKAENNLNEHAKTVDEQTKAAAAGILNGIANPVAALAVLGSGQEFPFWQKRDDIVLPEKVVDDYLKNDVAYNNLLVRKAKLEVDLQESIRVSTTGRNNPQAQRFEKDLAAIQPLIESRRNAVRPKLENDFQTKVTGDKKANQIALRNKIALYEQLEKEFADLVKDSETKVGGIGKDTITIEEYRAQLQDAENKVKRVADRVEALTVEKGAGRRVTSFFDNEPYVIHPEEWKRKLLAAGAAGIVTLSLVLFLIAWLEYRPRRVHSVDEIQDLGVPLVGTVPALPTRRQFRLLNANGEPNLWHSILTESVDTARTMLLHSARSERTQIVMVTSATSGEGKTSLSSHLAASLARAGRKTLLVDCDLRNPALHRLFGTARSPGLCEVLRGETAVSAVIWQAPAPGLSLIPAGRCDGQALQALAQDGFRKTSELIRPDYDFIVVDSAPVLPVADSLLVGQCVDAVIFSVLRDVSRLPKVYTAYQRLDKLGIRMLGAVVSGTHVDVYAPEYQYVTQSEDE